MPSALAGSCLQRAQSPSAAFQSSVSHLVLTTSVLLASRCSALHLVVLEKHFVWILWSNPDKIEGQSNSTSLFTSSLTYKCGEMPANDSSTHSFELFLHTEVRLRCCGHFETCRWLRNNVSMMSTKVQDTGYFGIFIFSNARYRQQTKPIFCHCA